ncbi:MAG: hypothetical protein ACLPT4_13245 [Verrucomicrobiia bacterium]
MIPGHNKRAPEQPQPAGGCILEFEDLWSEHRQFRGWLESATSGLVAPAKQRIRTEVEAHYRQAVAAHVAEGLSEPRAKIAAVAELGDPGAAWKRFRRNHLTTEDAKGAARSLKWAGSFWWLLGMYLLFCFVQYLDRDLGQEKHYLAPSTLFAIEFLGLVVVPTACFFVARHKNSKPNTCWIVLVQRSALYVCMLSQWLCTDGPGVRFLVSCLWFAGCILFPPVRLWRKLRRAGDDWPEMPPQKTASS